jgi:hypothetical protein
VSERRGDVSDARFAPFAVAIRRRLNAWHPFDLSHSTPATGNAAAGADEWHLEAR